MSDLAHRYTSRLASALGVPEKNDAVGGAAITDIAQQGWPRVLRNWHVPPAAGPPYAQVAGGYNLHVLHYGENDLTRAGASPNAPILNALRACLYHLRAPGSFEDDDPSVSGGGTQEAKADRNSGAGTRRLSQGEALTISGPPLDAEWPGGEIGLRFVVETGDTALVSLTVDGGPSVVVSLSSDGNIGSLANQAGPVTRALELDAGHHSIEVRAGVAAGPGIQFDGYTVHPNGFVPPIILLPGAHTLTANAYSFYYGATPYAPLTDAKVLSFNAAVETLAGEFSDGRVIYADVDPVLNKQGLSDLIHPDDEHAAMIAAMMVDLFRT